MAKRVGKTGKRRNRSPAFSRTHKVVIYLTAGEEADMKLMGEAWGSTVPVAIWCLIASWLAIRRDRHVMELPYSRMARHILDKARRLEQDLEYRGLIPTAEEDRANDFETPGDSDSEVSEPDPVSSLRRRVKRHPAIGGEG